MRPSSKGGSSKFWLGIWGASVAHKEGSQWLNHVEDAYYVDVHQKNYEVSTTKVQETISKLKQNNAPGKGITTPHWDNQSSLLIPWLTKLIGETYQGRTQLPQWITTTRTILLPKSHETKCAKSYRPIACQNIVFKVYTGVENNFIQEHCTSNNIITPQKTAAIKGSRW